MAWAKTYKAFEHTDYGIKHPDIAVGGERDHFCGRCDEEIKVGKDFEEA
jgi:hypothetical protein